MHLNTQYLLLYYDYYIIYYIVEGVKFKLYPVS